VSNDNIQLIKEAKNGNMKAREKLIQENLGLIWSIVKRFVSRGFEKEELFQIGCIGLIKAVDNFDLTYDVKFSTYAVPMILGEIKRFLRDNSAINVSRALKNTAEKVSKAKQELQNEKGRDPTINEIADKINIDPAEIVLALEASQRVYSLEEPIYNSNGLPLLLYDVIPDKDQELQLIDRIALKEALSKLDKNERQIIILRYFKDMTQVDVAKMLNMTQVQVSRLERKLLKKVKSLLS